MIEAQYLIRSEGQGQLSASRTSNPPPAPLHPLSDPRVTPRIFECARMTPDDASSMTWAAPMMRFAASFNQRRYAECVSYLEETYGGNVNRGSIPAGEQVCRRRWHQHHYIPIPGHQHSKPQIFHPQPPPTPAMDYRPSTVKCEVCTLKPQTCNRRGQRGFTPC